MNKTKATSLLQPESQSALQALSNRACTQGSISAGQSAVRKWSGLANFTE